MNKKRTVPILLLVILVLALIEIGVWYYAKKFSTPSTIQNGSTQQSSQFGTDLYDANKWELLKYLKVHSLQVPSISPKGVVIAPPEMRNINVYLLKSITQTGVSGAEAPLYGTNFIVARGAKILYQFTANSRYRDTQIEVRDVTNDSPHKSFLEITFSTYDSVGASDYIASMHILQYQPDSDSFKDISNKDFYDSATSGFTWFNLYLNSTTYGLVADPTGTRECHICDSHYIYKIYKWDTTSNTFVVYKTLTSDGEYGFVAWPEMIAEVGRKMAQ